MNKFHFPYLTGINNDAARASASGMAARFRIPPDKNTAFLPSRDKVAAPTAGATLTPAQQRRVRQLVRSLTAPKTKTTVKPVVKKPAATKPMVLKPGWRMVLPAEFGGAVDNAHFQMIRRA